jgi:Transglutaminase-like superfamily
MWERLRRFSSLDPEARGIFLRAAVLLPVISVSLRTRGFRATQESLLRFLAYPHHGSPEDSAGLLSDFERTQLTARMVNAAVRHAWYGSTCLEKSLALWWLLRQQGIASELRIGARKVQGKFEAHAWVEREGVAINEPGELHRHYAPFDEALSAPPLETQ